MSNNYIEKVAIVGAGGNSGSYMVEALLKTNKHTITAITRKESSSNFPDGVKVKNIDYNDPSTLIDALRGQDALQEQSKLIQAAADANVPWILPNEWSPDSASEALQKDLAMLWQTKKAARELIEKLRKSSWVCVTTGFWYEWSLSIPFAFGFDFEERGVSLYDDGSTVMNTSTWPQVGRAVASILSLPIKGDGTSLEQYRNKYVYVSSFAISQNDMLESVLRVTGTERSEWKITNKPSQECFDESAEKMKTGDYTAMRGWLYSRVFFPDGVGNYEKRRGLDNEALKLPKEDLDEATKRAIARAKEGAWKKW